MGVYAIDHRSRFVVEDLVLLLGLLEQVVGYLQLIPHRPELFLS